MEGDADQIGLVEQYAPEWTQHANLDFEFVDDPRADVRITFDEDDGPGSTPVAILSHGCWQRLFGGDPSIVGEEVQINGRSGSRNPSGSLYTFVPAKDGPQKDGEWNSFDIESRNDAIRVRVNGELVAEHAGDPERPKAGPIGLQLHDQFNFIMFRNIRIRELAPSR